MPNQRLISPSRGTSAGLILAVALGLIACGEGAADEPQPHTSTAAPCPTPAQIETAIGFPVTTVSMPVDGCMYELTGRYRGVFATMLYQPATRAPDVFADIRKHAKGMLGTAAEPDSVRLGEGGWGYSSRGKREAAAVSKGRLYHVEIDFNLFESLALKEDAAVRVIELGMKQAPGEAQAALDACTLASNAEVSQIAEERPEIAKFWEPPTASFGGSHCDYGGGSIRLYRGKSAAAAFESTLKSAKADKQPRVPVSGIGDKAFFMIPVPDNQYQRVGLLAVYSGADVLQLTLDAHQNESLDATRPRLERLAKLVLPRLR
jgi:hypothetical protein